MLIDVAIPGDRNVIKKEAEKILKYITEMQRMWIVKRKMIRVIIGETGTISKSVRQYLSNLPRKHEIKELKNSHIVHCTHTAEGSNVKVQIKLYGHIYVTCRPNCKYKTAATLYILETWFVSGK